MSWSRVIDWSLSLVTGPANLPVTVVEAKKQCEIAASDTSHDSHLRRLIAIATERVEHASRLRLVCQTWDQTQDWWPPGSGLELHVAPLLSVTSVKYYDTDGVQQTWTSTNYSADTKRPRPTIFQAYGVDWPSASTRAIPNAVVVRGVYGFGDVVTADADGDTLTPATKKFANGDIVQLSNYGGAVPAGLATGMTYYVVSAGATIQLAATSGGSAIDITDVGTGTTLIDTPPDMAKQAILLLVSHWFETREAVIVGATPNTVPLTYQSLIRALRPGFYP